MAAQTFTTIKNAVITALSNAPSPYTATTDDFETLFPQGTSYAENRIYRDMVMLATRQSNATLVSATGSRSFDLNNLVNADGGPIIVPEGFGLISPAGQSDPALGTVIPFKQAGLDWIDQIWPQQSVTMDPTLAQWIGRYWAMYDDHTIVVSPTPDAPAGAHYTAVVTGLFQPTPISSGNPTTYLSTYYPELLETAIMIFMVGWLQRNFSSTADDPAQAQSFETQYKNLLPGCIEEEQRRRGQGAAWTNSAPAPIAQPERA